MFFRLKKSGQRQYLQLVQSYWDKATKSVRQQVLATLGRYEQDEDIKKLKALLLSGERFCDQLMILSAHKSGQTDRVSTRRIGPVMIFDRLWEETGCQKVLQELLSQRFFEFDVERAIFTTVLHRLMESGSDRSCEKWRRDYAIKESDDELKLHHFYRAMSWLGEPLVLESDQDGIIPFSRRSTKDIIEEKLFHHRRDMFSGMEVVFFDTTSIYFEGEGGEELGQYGNSKDHRPDLKQLVVGVILDEKGYPICCEVWPGNTTDVKTLLPIVKRLKKRFKVNQVCIVSDRGMVSEKVLEWLEEEEWPYIIGVRMRRQKEVNEEVLSRSGRYHEVEGRNKRDQADQEGENRSKKVSPLKVKEVFVGASRYIVCVNEDQARKDAADREAIIKALEDQLKRGPKSMIGNKGYRKYIKVSGEGFEIDFQKMESESRYDGKWVLRTNTQYESGEVALKYKELWMVEQIFRNMKSLVHTRPVFHRSDEAIRGHVFCSFLALLLVKELHARLELRGSQLEWEDVLRDLNSMEEIEIEKAGKRFKLRTELKGCCGEVFGAVGVGIPPAFRQVNKNDSNEYLYV